MDFVELLKLKGFDTRARTKFVRHKTQEFDVEEMHRRGQLKIYESYQRPREFDKCQYMISFVGLEGTKAKLVALYKINGSKPAEQAPLPAEFMYPEMDVKGLNCYDLEELTGFEDYTSRIVIDWGRGTLAWHQNLRAKEVIEVLPKGYVTDFSGYLDFILKYNELKEIIKNPDANRVWHTMLSNVAGVYLIVDSATGKQYVGSAYGKSGIWGRWKEYAKNGHGGNQQLKSLLRNDPAYAINFNFSILRTLERTLTKREVIEQEKKYKDKLGSRAYGLNIN